MPWKESSVMEERRRFVARLIELDAPSEAWPRGRTALERYRIGKKVDAALGAVEARK